jgi:ketosteroid isomerase-like protein
MKLSSFFQVLAILVTLWLPAIGQSENRALREVVEAERAFAKASREKGTRYAFLENLGKSSHLYTKGEVVDGLEKWSQLPADSALLNWWPVYADASVSGDMGYTTGPYQYFRTRKDKTPAGSGFYSTVWRKESNGQWKVATDLGIGLRELPAYSKDVSFPKQTGKTQSLRNATAELQAVEADYLGRLNASSVSVLAKFLAPQFRVHRHRKKPVTNIAELQGLDDKNRFSFVQVGMEISSGGDLAYTFGKVTIEVIADGSSKLAPANYIRIWKQIEGEWKIVLDVIGG